MADRYTPERNRKIAAAPKEDEPAAPQVGLASELADELDARAGQEKDCPFFIRADALLLRRAASDLRELEKTALAIQVERKRSWKECDRLELAIARRDALLRDISAIFKTISPTAPILERIERELNPQYR